MSTILMTFPRFNSPNFMHFKLTASIFWGWSQHKAKNWGVRTPWTPMDGRRCPIPCTLSHWRHHCPPSIGLTENAGHENDAPSKLQGMKLQDVKMQAWKCRTWKWRTKIDGRARSCRSRNAVEI